MCSNVPRTSSHELDDTNSIGHVASGLNFGTSNGDLSGLDSRTKTKAVVDMIYIVAEDKQEIGGDREGIRYSSVSKLYHLRVGIVSGQTTQNLHLLNGLGNTCDSHIETLFHTPFMNTKGPSMCSITTDDKQLADVLLLQKVEDLVEIKSTS